MPDPDTKPTNPNPSDSILSVFHDDNYRFGNCSIVVYDRRRVDVFGTNYLYHLWSQCVLSRPTHPYGILPYAFCGMSDLSADTICAYLHTRSPLLLLCVDDPTGTTAFKPAGFAFPTVFAGIKSPERATLAGFTFFREYWGTPESTILGMLGLSYLFHELNLSAVHGQRYSTNVLAARYMAQFGSRDVGRVPRFILEDGKLTDCVISTLLREDFESYVRRTLIDLAEAGLGQGQQQHGTSRPGGSGR